jgi:hypothetical protein
VRWSWHQGEVSGGKWDRAQHSRLSRLDF